MQTNVSFQAGGEVATQTDQGTDAQPAQPPNGTVTRFAMSESSLIDLLHKAATNYPNRAAYKFIDYELDPKGITETLTWWQVYRRAMIVADELRICASRGDRAAILAPQGLEYIVAFLGALEAGLIAVPLPVPQFGIHDERISAALRDSLPTVIVTTSAVVDEVTKYVPHARAPQGPAPIVVAVDSLDLDSPREVATTPHARPGTAYIQYTSGSTRSPAGVVLSHKNVITNCVQLMSDYLGDTEKVPSTAVSWLPFYHDMGLMLGVILPMINQDTAVLLSPMAFLQRPARWMQLLGRHRGQISSAPNFGFELAVRRTSDDDMAGLDLGHVRAIATGAERVNPATVRRFLDRFAKFNLSQTAIRPSYGLAEATVYVATAGPGRPPKAVCFDYQQLAAGQARRCDSDADEGAKLVSYGTPRASTVRIVDPDASTETPAGTVGEIWVQGDNVAMGYWRNPELTERTFAAKLVDPSPGTPAGPWLRTGDLGVMFEGELFITGRIKDLLVVDGSNHYPDDIEATIQEITGGRVVAIAVPDDRTEQLVTVIEVTKWGHPDAEASERLRTLKREVTSAISRLHRVRVADVVMVAPGSIPVTTSGKVRRSACVERYLNQEFTRVDGAA
ncbi:acyl-CoA synthetase [Mycobacterium kansasii]|uniref:4-hydroxyphenylalkanoate adenylyltransferase n=2 Tax=Mycobacterium attenuatum TaxID=2341086 RepID=A0A498PWF5_9MYCO|nr:acyl-CoA synthetase [Mycobacterium kansasii]VBA37024.1 4-hydroxyphenylalkanoate adenylyltransferase [Mycobacterium attenuatum]VBA49867.1 4-hydroxyphenylalkanoate adenylyltransferase [Mycobacterium attenuatum]